MCGIAGAVGYIDQTIEDAVSVMTESLRHRGPDAGAIWKNNQSQSNQGCVFGHRRLAIIDLREVSNQPMLDPVTGNVIVYNGEIYNFQEIRKELQNNGVSFNTNSDTEVVLKAYAFWGRGCVSHFRGMFAFAIWESNEQRVFFARDRLGIKPLYWTTVGSGENKTILFSSELRSILNTGKVARNLDTDSLYSYIWNGFVVGPKTIIKDVHLIPPAYSGYFLPNGNLEQLKQYWQIPCNNGEQQDIEEVRDALETAVNMRMISDVPIGVFLSGGIDSSAIAALATKSNVSQLRTYTVTFDEAEYNEAPYARAVANELGSEHTELHLTKSMFQSGLEAGLEAMDQPTFDMLNNYFLSQIVRDSGVKVSLAGVGGDELFGGYTSFKDIPNAMLLSRITSFLPSSFLNAATSLASRFLTGKPGPVPPQTRWGKLKDVFTTKGDLNQLYQTSYALFTKEFIERLLISDITTSPNGMSEDVMKKLSSLTKKGSKLQSITAMELSLFVGERLLRDTDVASMASALEVRVPLIDHKVIELCAQLEDNTRYQPLGRKALLQDMALSEVDRSTFDRPKMGFVIPLDKWCRDKLTGHMESAFSDHAACEAVGLRQDTVWALWTAFKQKMPGLYWSRIWSIYVLLEWCRRHKVRIA